MDHFFILICGLLLHGNIGIIYTNERNPQKIKNCKFPKCTKTNCLYYHPPTTFNGSRDYRNFIAGSWMYSAPASPLRNSHKNRVLGSRENINIDMTIIDEEDREVFYDQLIHDILCAMLLKKFT
jgi:hypothetical protein